MNFLALFTPNNILQERSKFFNSPTYNPQFQYERDLEEFNEYIKKFPSKKDFANALLSNDTHKITDEAQKIFSVKLDKNKIAAAEDILRKDLVKINHAPVAIDLQKELRKGLDFFDINYTVEIVDRSGFNIRPNHRDKTLLISKYADLGGIFSVETSVKHELTHVIRYINKEFNDYKRSRNALPTEEGFASYIGDFHSNEGFNSLYHHAAEYKATEIGLNGSLRDIFNYFMSLRYDDEFSWQRAIRHKFGFTDTSKPGDIMKPAMYFHYEIDIKDFSLDHKLKLFSGKISIEDLNKYESYKGSIKADKLVEYFKL